MSALAKLMGSTGPVADAFVLDKRLITFIMGPVGSAKTTACIRKCVMIGLWQNRGLDGVRRARIAVIRDTYPQLKRTVLESWFTWFPKELGTWNGESPFMHKIRIATAAGPVELEMLFAAIGEAKVEDVMRGWEITALWINEGDLVSRDVFRLGLTRIGRYPGASLGGCAWRGIIVDLNAPANDNWTYPIMVDKEMGLSTEEETELREVLGEQFGIGFHRQPGGRSKDPPPENIQNLPKGYYAQMMIGQSSDFIRRMIDNEFGAVRNGMPVYPEFREQLHLAKTKLKAVRGTAIDVGVDGGLTPAAIVGQRLPNGQRLVLAELVVWVDKEKQELAQVGATAFGQLLRRFLADEFPDNPVRFVWVDPATKAGEDAEDADPSWRQLFQQALGMRARLAPVKANSLEIRLEAVRKCLRSLVAGGEPQYLLSPACKQNLRAKNSGYIYRRTSIAGGDDRYVNKPVKNQASHNQDAEQYLFCGWDHSPVDYSPSSYRNRSGREVKNDSNYDMFGDAA